MDANALIASLAHFADILPAVVGDLSREQATFRPGEGMWSIVEIVGHLVDTEVLDMRARLQHTLEDPTAPWTPIDPEGWAVQRRYQDDRLSDAVAKFVDERQMSVAWLRELESPDWARAREHPKFPMIRAGDLLSAWAAHDMLHLRQIAKRRFQMIERNAGIYSTGYAGEWKA